MTTPNKPEPKGFVSPVAWYFIAVAVAVAGFVAHELHGIW